MSLGRNEVHPFALIVAVGVVALAAWLRLDQLSGQWLMDDEWHAIHKLQRSSSYSEILSSFGVADYSIPLTAFYRFLTETIGLSELRMRFPMLVAGLALPAIAGAWAWRALSARTALLFAFLLAVSPMLVNYSRTARPYSLTLLFTILSVFLLVGFLRGQGWRYAIAYLIIAALAVYLHPITAPFFLTSVSAAALYFFLTGRTGALRKTALLLIALVSAICLIVIPPVLMDQAALAKKMSSSTPDFATVWGALHMWFGTGWSLTSAMACVFAILGVKRAKERFPELLALYVSGIVGILLAILVLQPAWVHNPLTFARYLLPTLPLLLLLVAIGVTDLAERISAQVRVYFVSVAAVMMLLGSPLPALLRESNNVTLHSLYQFDYRPDKSLVRLAMPKEVEGDAFWRYLAKFDPGFLTIALAGESSFESYANPAVLHQPIHRQELVKLQTGKQCGGRRNGEAFRDENIHLRNAVTLAPKSEMLAQGIDLIAFDMQLVGQGIGAPEGYFSSAKYKRYRSECVMWLRQNYGEPILEEPFLLVFQVSQRVNF